VSDVLARIRALVANGQVRPSIHGFRELAADDILLGELLGGVESAVVIEDYFDGASERLAMAANTAFTLFVLVIALVALAKLVFWG